MKTPEEIIPPEPDTLRSFEDILKNLDLPEIEVSANDKEMVFNTIVYDDVSAFCNKLASLGVIPIEECSQQINLCENWSAVEFRSWAEDFSSIIDLDHTELEKTRHALDQSNEAWNGIGLPKYSIHSKLVESIVSVERIEALVEGLARNKIIWHIDAKRQKELCCKWDYGTFLTWEEAIVLFDAEGLKDTGNGLILHRRQLYSHNERFSPWAKFQKRASWKQPDTEGTDEEQIKAAPSRDIDMAKMNQQVKRERELVEKEARDAFEIKIKLKIAEVKINKLNPEKTMRLNRHEDTTEIISKTGEVYTFSKSDSLSNKVEKLREIVAKGVMTIAQLRCIATPELNHEVMDIYEAKSFDQILEEDLNGIQVDWALDSEPLNEVEAGIEAIDELIANHNIKPESLDKYVALGVIDKGDLMNWRIADQARNQYFYDDDFSEPYETIERDIPDEPHTVRDLSAVENFVETLKTDVTAASIRVISSQAISATKSLISSSLSSDKNAAMKDFLDSQIGTSFVSMMAGMALTYGMEGSEKAQIIAEEMRIHSLATVGNEMMEGLTTAMKNVITDAVKTLPESEEHEEYELPEEGKAITAE